MSARASTGQAVLRQLKPQLIRDPAEFVAAASRGDRPEPALPLLDGPLVRRDLVRLRSDGRVARPDQPLRHPVGYLGADPYAAVARLLARLGGRPALPVALDDLPDPGDGTLTVVCGPDHVSRPLLMAAATRGSIGIFTARDLSGCCALLLRTISAGAESGRLLFDTDAPYSAAGSWLGGAAVLPKAVIGTADRRRRVVAGRSSARECAVLFGGRTLCGRAADEYGPARPGDRPTSCQQGLGCYRRDLSLEEGLDQPRVSEFAAAAVFLDSCSAVNVGGDFSTDVSLALSLLESDAVLVAGPPVDRISGAFAAPLFAALLATGMPAGRAVAEVNALTAPISAGEITLLGDSSAAWPPELLRHSAVLGQATSLRLALPPGEAANLALEGARWRHDRDIGELDREYAGLEQSVASYQEALVHYLLGAGQVGYRRYIAEWPQPVRFGASWKQACPNCHQPDLRMRPAAAGVFGPALLLGICDSCGIDTFEGAAGHASPGHFGRPVRRSA